MAKATGVSKTPGVALRCYLVTAFCAVVVLTSLSGCTAVGDQESADPVRYSAEEYGCSFALADGWLVTEEKRRPESLTLRLVKEDGLNAFSCTVTIGTAGSDTAERIVEQAEEALRRGLYALEEPVLHRTFTMPSGAAIPLLEARAGNKDKIEARSAIISGSDYYALVTLISRLEYINFAEPEFHALLGSFTLE